MSKSFPGRKRCRRAFQLGWAYPRRPNPYANPRLAGLFARGQAWKLAGKQATLTHVRTRQRAPGRYESRRRSPSPSGRGSSGATGSRTS